MIRQAACRAIVQNNDGANDDLNSGNRNKYELKVISGSCTDQYPFQNQTADIQVVSNSKKGTSGYTLPIYSDDFIRFQVATKYCNGSWTPWRDLFIGQIQSAKSVYESTNTLNLHCIGLLNEVMFTPIYEITGTTEDGSFTWNGGWDATEYFNHFLTSRELRRYLTYSTNYVVTGAKIPTFTCTQNRTYFADLIHTAEEQSDYTYRAFAVPEFDSNGNISTIYLGWKPRADILTQKTPLESITNSYAVIEGSWRYISSEFASTIEELRNRVVVVGSTENKVIDAYQDTDSISNYGLRQRVDTCNWLTTTAECYNTSKAICKYSKDPDICGTATILGTSAAKPLDLVYCKSPSQEVDGNSIDTVLPVYRVSQNISPSGVWTTSLDLGKTNKDAYDYLGMMSKNIRTLQQNAVKC